MKIALLRAVNLAGHNPLKMADLRALAAGAGCTDAQTLLQSGNLVFRGGRSGATDESIEETLQAAARRRLKLETEFFVRSAEEWRAIIAANPFREEASRDPGHLVLMVFKSAPAAASIEALRGAIVGRETVRAGGRHAYFVYPDGIGRSKLTAALIEKKLGTRGTARNWNTVLKLAEMVGVEPC